MYLWKLLSRHIPFTVAMINKDNPESYPNIRSDRQWENQMKGQKTCVQTSD